MRKFYIFLILLLCAGTSVVAQSRVFSGVIRGQNDSLPLPGVSIKVEGSTIGTQTNTEGYFSLTAPANATLIVSCLSYVSQKLKPGGQTSVNIMLVTDSKSLDEVVVTSFGIVKDKKTLGYGVSQVKAEDIRKAPTPDITNALVGKVAGVQVSGTGGGFGSSNIIIRGFTTFTGSNQPLMVVDGVPINNTGGSNSVNTGISSSNRASDINPEDIESLNVLKGAAATVLYGSRAASGAILIVTKKGKAGSRNRINVSSDYAVGSINRFPTFQNQYAQGDKGVYSPAVSGSWGPLIAGQTVTNYFQQPEVLHAYPNNVKDILQHSISNQNDVSFTGSSQKSTYRLAVGNANETALVPNNKLSKNTVSLNAGTYLSDKLKVNTYLSYTNNTSDRTQAGNQGSNPLWRGIYTPRSYNLSGLPYQDAAGVQQWFAGEDQPYWAIEHVKYHQEVNRFFGNVNLNYAIASWIQADLKVGADVFSNSSQGFDDKGVRGNANTASAGKGGLADNINNVRNINSYFTVTANKRRGDFNFSGTVGNELVSNYSRSLNGTGTDIVVPGFQNLKNFVTLSNSDSYTQSRIIGLFGDFVAEYQNFLTLNVKARNDWSSTLSPGNWSIFYPAVALSFVPTEKWTSLKGGVLNQIKIRANAGEVGKSPAAYNTDTYYGKASAGDGFGSTGVSFPFNGLVGYTYNNGAGNPFLTPEFTREVELGGEFVLFNNRLSLDLSVYKRDTRNLIYSVPVPASSGFTSLTQNAGKLSTRGIEFLLSGSPVRSRNFNWDALVNFTSFRSVVKELSPGVTAVILGGFTSPDTRLVPGEEYGQIYSTYYKRDNQGNMILGTTGLPIVSSGTNSIKKIGNPNPRFTVGVTNTFSYKAFSLSFLIDGRYKGDLLSRTVGDLRINGVSDETAKFPRFNTDGTIAKPYIFPGVLENGRVNDIYVTAQDYWSTRGKYVAWEGYVLDATFIKLRELSLSYNVPRSLLGKTRIISGLQLSAYGRNLFTYAPHFPDLDPEQNLLGVSNSTGLEFGIQPVAKTMGGSLRVTF